MFEVKSHYMISMFHKPIMAWSVVNRRTNEVIGEYEQLSIANAIAAGKNRGV